MKFGVFTKSGRFCERSISTYISIEGGVGEGIRDKGYIGAI